MYHSRPCDWTALNNPTCRLSAQGLPLCPKRCAVLSGAGGTASCFPTFTNQLKYNSASALYLKIFRV